MTPPFQPGQQPQPAQQQFAPAAPAPQPQPQPAAPPQAAAPGQADDGGMESQGPQRVANTEFNQQLQNILLSRIEEERQKNPTYGDALDQALTGNPQAAIDLALLLPELIPVLRAMGVLPGGDAGQGAGPIGAADPQQEQGPAAGGGFQPGNPGAADASGYGSDESAGSDAAADDEDDEDDEENPILNSAPGVSQGLMG